MSDDDLLLSALGQDPEAWTNIEERYNKQLRHWCWRRAQDIPEDIWDDVIQETFCSLFKKLSDFDPTRGKANQFVFGLFLNAEKKVRRMYGLSQHEVEIQYLSQESDRDELTLTDTLADPDNDTEPSAERLHIKETARNIVDQSKISAPAFIKEAIQLLATKDELSMSQVAVQLGVDRVTLTRQIRAWAVHYEHLVAA